MANKKESKKWLLVKNGVVIFKGTEKECAKKIMKDITGQLEIYPEEARIK